MATHLAEDGTVRQDHYGEGEQPWDTIVRLGYAPQFAAGNVLKYLRRTKAPEHSLESARWYYARLHELVVTQPNAIKILERLEDALTVKERKMLTDAT